MKIFMLLIAIVIKVHNAQAADGVQAINFYNPGKLGIVKPKIGDYVQFNSSYEYDLEDIVPHLKSPYKFANDLNSLSKISGVASGERCHYVYNEDEALSGQSIWEKFSSDMNVSRSPNCNIPNQESGEYCKCADNLKCMNSADIRVNGNSEPLNVDYSTMAPDVCPFYVDCPSGLDSPKDKCNSDGGSNCSTKTDKCLQFKQCGLGAEFLELESGNIFVSCDEDWNCASGYCTEVSSSLRQEIIDLSNDTITSSQIPSKVCMPVSNCRPSCSEDGETVPQDGFCCAGLSQVQNSNDGQYYCYNSIETFEEIPGEIEMSITDDCQIIMNELDDDGGLVYEGSCNLRGKTTSTECSSAGGKWTAGNAFMPIKENVYHFERYFAGIEWLWTDADSPGTDDFFKNNVKAIRIGEILRSYKESADSALFNELVSIEADRAREEAKVAEGGQTVSGSFSVKLLARLANTQAAVASNKRAAMESILGFNVSEINNLIQNSPDEIPTWLKNYIQDEKTWNSLARYRNLALYPEKNTDHNIGSYYSLCRKKNSSNCSDTPKNICKNQQQQNRYCVREAWDTKGILPGYLIDPDDPNSLITVLIDPVYPSKLHEFVTTSSNFIDFDEDQFIAYFKNIILIEAANAGSSNSAPARAPMPEIKLDTYDDNPDLLNATLFKAFADYANTPRDTSDCVSMSLYKSNMIIDVDEWGMILRDSYPDFTDRQIASVLEQITPEVKRQFAQQAIADLMQYHLAKLHLPHGGTGMNTYCTSTNIFGSCTNEISTATAWENDYYYEETYKALHLNRMILMAGYLARYYAAAETALAQKAQCLYDKADVIDEQFNAFGQGGSQQVNIALSVSRFDEVEAMKVENNCGSGGGGGGGGGSGVNSLDSTLNSSDAVSQANETNKTESNLGTQVGTSGIDLGSTSAGKGIGNSSDNNVGASGDSNLESFNKDSQSKLNAIFKAKSKAKKNFLNKIGLNDPNKGKNAAARMANELKKAFPLKKALDKTLARNGIDLGVMTASLNSGEIKPKEAVTIDVTKIKDVENKEKEIIKKKRVISFGGKNADSLSSAQNHELLNAVKKDANKIKKEESENIWEQITKSYLLIGVPRLFDDKKK